MDEKRILAARMERHGFARRAQTDGEFRRLVRTLQPLAPEYMSMPGSAPRLMHRTSNDDEEMANRLRASRELVKGRFAAGNVSYVLQEDLELYATAFRKPLSRFNDEHDLIQRTLQSTGPLSTRQLREETGLSHKKLMPAVHRLQQAFLLYEDQEDESWERPWSLFESEWPEVDLERMDKMAAVVEVITRFLRSHVFATTEQIRNWSQLREAKKAVGEMEAVGTLANCKAPGVAGWMLEEDESLPRAEPKRSVYMIHKADPMARPHVPELKEHYKQRDVLQYLLIDGRFRGAVCGHWRIRPHDVEDIALDLSEREVADRREAVLAAVEAGYPPPDRRVLRYNGRELV